MDGIDKQAAFYRAYLPHDRSLIPVAVALGAIVALWLSLYSVGSRAKPASGQEGSTRRGRARLPTCKPLSPKEAWRSAVVSRWRAGAEDGVKFVERDGVAAGPLRRDHLTSLDSQPLLEQLQVDRVAHGAIAGVVRVEVVANVVVGANPGRMVGVAHRGVEIDHRVERAAASESRRSPPRASPLPPAGSSRGKSCLRTG